MELSKRAKDDLRKVLSNNFGEDFSKDYTDEEINEIGDLLLNILYEGCKLRCENKKIPN